MIWATWNFAVWAEMPRAPPISRLPRPWLDFDQHLALAWCQALGAAAGAAPLAGALEAQRFGRERRRRRDEAGRGRQHGTGDRLDRRALRQHRAAIDQPLADTLVAGLGQQDEARAFAGGGVVAGGIGRVGELDDDDLRAAVGRLAQRAERRRGQHHLETLARREARGEAGPHER